MVGFLVGGQSPKLYEQAVELNAAASTGVPEKRWKRKAILELERKDSVT